MPTSSSVATSLTRAVGQLDPAQGLEHSLDVLLRLAADLIDEVHHVSFRIERRSRSALVRGTSPLALEIERLGDRCSSSPRAAVLRDAVDLLVDDRDAFAEWPDFAAAAELRGVHQQLYLRIAVEHQPLGVMTLSSTTPVRLGPDVQEVAELLRAQAALVLAQARQVENLNLALDSRRLIGLGLGLVMQRYQLSEDAAFDYLARISASTETKMRDVAQRLVDEHRSRVGSHAAAPPVEPDTHH